QERQQALLAELRQRPEERAHSGWARRDVGHGGGGVDLRRREERDASERLGLQPEQLVARRFLRVELDVLAVQEQQVLAFHVEHERLRVHGLRPERAGGEQALEQERRVGRLRRDAGDAADVDVRASRAVDELQVGEQGLLV